MINNIFWNYYQMIDKAKKKKKNNHNNKQRVVRVSIITQVQIILIFVRV